MNFMAAIGPSFKRGFVDTVPVSNADIGHTLAHILGLDIPPKGKLLGRVITEALPGNEMPDVRHQTLRSRPTVANLATILMIQHVSATRYFDAAGFPGRTVGLRETAASR
jgi:hypothetical protein